MNMLHNAISFFCYLDTSQDEIMSLFSDDVHILILAISLGLWFQTD